MSEGSQLRQHSRNHFIAAASVAVVPPPNEFRDLVRCYGAQSCHYKSVSYGVPKSIVTVIEVSNGDL
jgi:hypothetical protein